MSQVQQVKDASDIVAIIGERIGLTRAGSQYRALCPFHSERSPSFFVSESMQRYKCFGCGESGDVFEFLQKYEGMSFGESLRFLADKSGIVLKEYEDNQQDKLRNQLLVVLELAAAYYHYLLTKHKAGQTAQKYLKNRGVKPSSIKLFRLGCSLPAWDGLTVYLTKKKGYSPDLLIQAGLAIKGRGGQIYDRFRDRVMFPLTNARGQVVGFSGRTLLKDVKEAKYINSPETALYHKSQLLFGLSQLRQLIRQKNQVVVVEGELDVISSVQAGINQVVAIKGSALTSDHARLLARLVNQVLLALDSDSAGVEATKKAIKALTGYATELRVIVLPQGKDPDELCQTDPAGWRQSIDNSISAYEFLIKTALATHNIKESAGRTRVLRELAPIFASIESSVERQFYLERLAQALNARPELVARDLNLYQKGVGVSGSTPQSTELAESQAKKVNRLVQLERSLLYILVTASSDDLAQFKFDATQFKSAKLLVAYWQAMIKYHFDQKLALSKLSVQDQQTISDIYFDQNLAESYAQVDRMDVFVTLLTQLKTELVKAEKQQIAQELKTLATIVDKTDADEQKEQSLLAKLAQLSVEQKINKNT